MTEEIRITYETLFELLRREKNREELQDLSETFFADVADYLNGKNNLLKKPDDDIFSSTERSKTSKQLENAKRIFIEIYGWREKKIMNMAVEKSITSSRLIDTSPLLDEEQRLFDDLAEIIGKYRKGLLYNVLESKIPETNKQDQEIKEQEKPEIVPEPGNMKVKFLDQVQKFLGKELALSTRMMKLNCLKNWPRF